MSGLFDLKTDASFPSLAGRTSFSVQLVTVAHQQKHTFNSCRMKLLQFAVAAVVVCIALFASAQASETETKDEYQANEVINKSPEELIKLRGFNYETHFAKTKDGYSIHIVRIVNPNVEALKKPVLFSHGFLESSTIWLIQSRFSRPLEHVRDVCSPISGDEESSNLPMMMSNRGYDVWLMSFRGTDWSLKHESKNKTQSEFWDFSLDDFAQTDVPTAVDFVRKHTGHEKIGYIGHSQATFSIFGLLAVRPEYADVIEPVVAFAPVTFVGGVESSLRALFVGANAEPIKKKNAPFPRFARKLRASLSKLCHKASLKVIKYACQVVERTAVGKGKHLKNGFFNHLPFYSSLKVVRHFGQLIESNRIQMYDHGQEENIVRYNTNKPQEYPIENIKSKSIVIVNTETDNLTEPKGVEQFIRTIKVPLLKQIFIKGDFNHLDIIINSKARKLIFEPVLKVFETFEFEEGFCSKINHHRTKPDKEQTNEIASN